MWSSMERVSVSAGDKVRSLKRSKTLVAAADQHERKKICVTTVSLLQNIIFKQSMPLKKKDPD